MIKKLRVPIRVQFLVIALSLAVTTTVLGLVAVSAAIAALFGITTLILVIAGFRPFILKTQSMEPIYTQGSLCWVDTRVSLDILEVGDTLVYRSPANSLVLHRLVGIRESNTPSLSGFISNPYLAG